MHILVVDDDVRLARHIMSGLTHEGHDAVVVHEGEAGLEKAMAGNFELIVLDVAMPRLDGFEVLRRLRACKISTRILMLTARGEVGDRVAGLELGADDYLAKPFAMQELLARVRALSRRYTEEPALSLQVANLVVNLADHAVHRGTTAIELSSRELTLLKVLMREPGRTFTRTELCERVWERQHEYDMKLVEVFVGRLRKKLGEPVLIHTVRHIGYTMREP
jgi:DNA-binding response OmpR family regulator